VGSGPYHGRAGGTVGPEAPILVQALRVRNLIVPLFIVPIPKGGNDQEPVPPFFYGFQEITEDQKGARDVLKGTVGSFFLQDFQSMEGVIPEGDFAGKKRPFLAA
jgi:hypothetical protein